MYDVVTSHSSALVCFSFFFCYTDTIKLVLQATLIILQWLFPFVYEYSDATLVNGDSELANGDEHKPKPTDIINITGRKENCEKAKAALEVSATGQSIHAKFSSGTPQVIYSPGQVQELLTEDSKSPKFTWQSQ